MRQNERFKADVRGILWINRRRNAGQTDMQPIHVPERTTMKTKLIPLALSCGMTLALMTIAGCGNQAAPPAGTVTPAVSVAQPPKMKMTTDIPAAITTPDSVETRLGTLKFFDGFPDEATVQEVYDNLDFERGVQAFLTAMPGASAYALREGLRSQGADNQTVLITENLMDSKSHHVAGCEGRAFGDRESAGCSGCRG
jgi:hypothetical protein